MANKPEIPESKVLVPDAEKVIAPVCDYYRIPGSELLVSKRGIENPPRDIAIYLVRQLYRMTLPYVGRKLGIQNYSTANSVVQRVKSRVGGLDLWLIPKNEDRNSGIHAVGPLIVKRNFGVYGVGPS